MPHRINSEMPTIEKVSLFMSTEATTKFNNKCISVVPIISMWRISYCFGLNTAQYHYYRLAQPLKHIMESFFFISMKYREIPSNIEMQTENMLH